MASAAENTTYSTIFSTQPLNNEDFDSNIPAIIAPPISLDTTTTTSKQTVYPPHKITPAPPQPFVVPPQSYPISVAKQTQNSFDKTQDDIVQAITCQITRKRKEDPNEGDQDGYNNKNSPLEKSSRRVYWNSPLKMSSRRIYWTREMHLQFLAAVNQLGIDKADSNKILELMNVENVTRENVDQHLEQYKMRLEGPPKTRMEVVYYSATSAEPMVSVKLGPPS